MTDRPEPFRGEITTASAATNPEHRTIYEALRRQFGLKEGAQVNRIVISDETIELEYFPQARVGETPTMRKVSAKRVPADKYDAPTADQPHTHRQA